MTVSLKFIYDMLYFCYSNSDALEDTENARYVHVLSITFQSPNVDGWFTVSTIKQVYHFTYGLHCLHIVNFVLFVLNLSFTMKEESAVYAFPFKSMFTLN